MTDYQTREDVKLEVNGMTLRASSFMCNNTTNSTFSYDVPLEALRRGLNRFELCVPKAVPTGGKIHFIDFLLKLDYPDASREK